MFSLYGLLVLLTLALAAIATLPLPNPLSEHMEVIGNVLLVPLYAGALWYSLSAWDRPPSSTLIVAAHSLSVVMYRFALFVYLTVRNVGMFAEFVDSLFRNEERRSALESEYAKLRTEYNMQLEKIDTLNGKALKVCKERNKRSHESDFVAAFASRRWPHTKPEKDQVSEWCEPYMLVKLCKFESLSCPPVQPRPSISSLFSVASADTGKSCDLHSLFTRR